MSNPTPAQEEFANLFSRNTGEGNRAHPEDRAEEDAAYHSSGDEEDRYRANQIDAAMRMPTFDSAAPGSVMDIKLPPASFDAGRTTGVKGVIADARSYENARRSKWKDRVRAARQSVFGSPPPPAERRSDLDSDGSGAEDPDEEAFLEQWRESRRRELESRRRELESETAKGAIRNRRTSPSLRIFGRLDEVDALGYLDAIEKVGRETVVAVFVYDHECEVSALVESALLNLVGAHPTVHFVKVHYEEIEFDPAAVPAILGYRNQGDLFANLTGLIEHIPEDDDFTTATMKRLLQQNGVL